MGIVSTILGLIGFGWGISLGLVVGYFLFIYMQPTDVKDPIIRPLAELDAQSLEALLQDIPLWVKNPDYDRVDWLNKFLKDLWPYLDKAVCKMIREQAQPYIDQYGPKFKLDSIEFESLTLGTLPPTFVGMKVYDTKEKEMILEPSFKFAGNPNIIVAVKAFGMKATVQLIDVQVFATARITLKPLIPVFPCFSKIVISLMDKPHVDFGLKLLGGDLMAIPGLYGFVQDFIKNQVAEMYMWPKTLEIPVINDPSAAKRPVGILEVKICRAQKLQKKDFLGKADPYVKIQLVNTVLSKTTRTKMNTLSPEWNETFKLLVQDPKSQSLELQVFDWEKIGAHDKLGMQIVPLADLEELVPKTMTVPLLKNMDANDETNTKKFRGELTFEMTYKPFKNDDNLPDVAEEAMNGVEKAPEGTPETGGLLVVTVHEGEDLEGKHHTNPFARVIFKGDKKETPVMKKNRDPRWDKEFMWQCEEPPLNDRLHVEVHSKGSSMNMVHPKEMLGYVDIPLGDVVANRRINEKYQLIDSARGKIQVELEWRTTG
jgi:Ca2+-dependent lipid-binding protein